MKEMINIIPIGSCPKCGHKQFVVVESQQNIYLTDRDGEILDHRELYNHSVGKCVNCKSEYDMIPTRYGFIPATELRKILYKYTVHYIEEEPIKYIDNPMGV